MDNKKDSCDCCHCHNEGNHKKNFFERFKHRSKAFSDGLHEFYYAPYRSMLAREYRDQNDLFMMMIFSESLGIPNPVEFYTLELQPVLLELFHEWHTRMGMEKSPIDHFGCC